MHVVLDHAVGVLILTGDPTQLWLDVCTEMHPCAVPPDEKRFPGLMGTVYKIQRSIERFVVYGLHSLPRQRTGILDLSVGR